jgi:hypothetical protein
MADDTTKRLNLSPTGQQAGDSDEVAKLRKENADLKAKLAEVDNQADTRPVPHRPSFGLTEGERADLEQRGVTTDPFTGDLLTAKSEGVETSNDEAKDASDKAEKQRKADAKNDDK